MGSVIQLSGFRKDKQGLIYKISNSLRDNGFYTANFNCKRFTDEPVENYPLNQLKILYPSKFSLIIGDYIIGRPMQNIADLLFEDTKTRASFYNQWVLSVPVFNKKVARLCGLLIKITEKYNVSLAISGSVSSEDKILDFENIVKLFHD